MKNRRKTHLAIDLGASSGRVMAGHHDGGRLEIEEVARFGNSGVELSDGWHWDAEGLFEEIKKGLAIAAERFGDDIVSVAVDTWGVDYVILDEAGKPINPPWMYRDSRTDGMMDKANKTLGPDRLWERTGIQPMFFNTIYQLMAEVARNGDRLRKANEILFIPDYINYRLSGVRAIERTIASTSGLLFAGSPEWDVEIAAELNIPTLLLSPVTEPCRVLGEISPSIAAETGLRGVKVCTCGSHDTASAVAGAPSRGHPLFLSSGTWSLLGIELRRPINSTAARQAGFSNEQGLEGRTRFLTNIAGMWLLQECRRVWAEQGKNIDYGTMVEMAAQAKAPAFINPDAPEFQKPCDMPKAILDWIQKSGQTAPANDSELIRTILESLALKYRRMVRRLAELVPEMPSTLNIVGGGGQNKLLNQMTADATGLRVEAGPVEATAAGNVIAQMIASGDISSLAEGRELLRNSFEISSYEPGDTAAWDAKAARFDQILG
ncbi:MAG: Rhamnulokinase [Verrucomicrobiota bacterium]|jgi:rhamnulokinase